MNDGIDPLLSKYTQRIGEDSSDVLNADPTIPSDLGGLGGGAGGDEGCWGWLRGAQDRASMIELRRRDGTILAVGYGYLDRAELDPAEGIRLHIGSRTIRITGRNLNAERRPNLRLFTTITRHRCTWIRETDESEAMTKPPTETVIESIQW